MIGQLGEGAPPGTGQVRRAPLLTSSRPAGADRSPRRSYRPHRGGVARWPVCMSEQGRWPAPRISSMSTLWWAPTTTVRPRWMTRLNRWCSGPPGTAARAWTARSTRPTSWRSPRRSWSIALPPGSTARSTSDGTPTRCPSRHSARHWRSSPPPGWRCAWMPGTHRRRLRRSPTRSCGTTARVPAKACAPRDPAWPMASWSPPRTTPRATVASSTTHRTAAQPVRMRPPRSRRGRTSCCAPASRRWPGPRTNGHSTHRTWPSTTICSPMWTIWTRCWTWTRSARLGCASVRTRWAGRRWSTGRRSPTATTWT